MPSIIETKVTKMPDVKISKEKKPDKLTRVDGILHTGSFSGASSSQSGFAGTSSKETGFANFNPSTTQLNVYQVVKGQTLSPLTCGGILKKPSGTLPTISLTTLQTFKTLVTIPDYFGVVQNIVSGEQVLMVHFAGVGGSPVLGDLLLGAYVILSGGIAEISVTGGGPDQKAFLPIALTVF